MKKDYMTRLERAARWRLPPQEAEEVIADYRDIVGTPPRPEEELTRELGEPKDAVMQLTTVKQYRIWQAVFVVMTVCILAPGISGSILGAPFWELYFFDWLAGLRYSSDPPNAFLVAALGMVTALVWFRWKGYKSKRFPKTVPILLGVLTLWTGGILLADWLVLRDPVGFSEVLGEIPAFIGPNPTMSLSNLIFGEALIYSAAAMAGLGTFALVRARTQDRRWAAVYVLAMATLLVPLLTVDMFGSMNPAFDPLPENWYLSYLGQYAAIFAAGLVGAGVALC